jgi:hypothetical protein
VGFVRGASSGSIRGRTYTENEQKMSIVSIRYNYEDLVDRRAIKELEARENDGSVIFVPSDQVLKELEEPSQ